MTSSSSTVRQQDKPISTWLICPGSNAIGKQVFSCFTALCCSHAPSRVSFAFLEYFPNLLYRKAVGMIVVKPAWVLKREARLPTMADNLLLLAPCWCLVEQQERNKEGETGMAQCSRKAYSVMQCHDNTSRYRTRNDTTALWPGLVVAAAGELGQGNGGETCHGGSPVATAIYQQLHQH